MYQDLPKIELHCHLDGSIPPATFRKLAQRAHVDIPADEKELLDLLQVPEDCASLEEALERFALPLSVLVDKESFEMAVYALLEQAAGEGVKYMEVRYAPLLSVSDTLSAEDTVAGCVKGMERAQKDFGIRSNLLLCAMRHLPEEENMPLVDLAEKWLGKGVCGLDLAGGEDGNPCTNHANFFAKAREKGIPFTIHAGETGNPESIRQAFSLGAKRIGHGVCLVQDPDLMQEAKEKQIAVEMCPTSNLQTKIVTDLSTYPVPDYVAAGIPVSINTDNRTVSGTTLCQEMEKLHAAGRLPDEKAWMAGLVDSTFADEKTKDWLRNFYR